MQFLRCKVCSRVHMYIQVVDYRIADHKLCSLIGKTLHAIVTPKGLNEQIYSTTCLDTEGNISALSVSD